MTRFISFISIVFLAVGMLSAADLRPPERTAPFDNHGITEAYPPRFQNGFMYSMNASRNAIWVKHVTEGLKFNKVLEVPDSFRVQISSIAVSFDDRVAASATVIDRRGAYVSIVALLDLDGSLIKVIRPESFRARRVGFTGDGSLWMSGFGIENNREPPVHDILRQYDADGLLVRSLISRNSMSTEPRHPMWNAQMATSRNYVAIVSNVAKKWAVVSSEGIIVSTGSFVADETRGNFRGFVTVAVTDSGRVFGHALFRENNRVDATFRAMQVFELARNQLRLKPVGTNRAYPASGRNRLTGTDGENLVFNTNPIGGPNRSIAARQVVWAQADSDADRRK